MIRFHIISIFPGSVSSYLGSSMLWRAQDKKYISIKVYDPRDFTRDKHKKVDGRPYGGGPGMVLAAQPILSCVEKIKRDGDRRKGEKKLKIVMFAPGGKQFTQEMAGKMAKTYSDVIFIAGHYEGIDARVKKILKAEEMTIGPYVLTGGELPAMAMIDAISRFIPGFLGNNTSREELRVASSETYTRPPELEYKGKTYKVPKVLQSGHHADIENWKKGKKKGGV